VLINGEQVKSTTVYRVFMRESALRRQRIASQGVLAIWRWWSGKSGYILKDSAYRALLFRQGLASEVYDQYGNPLNLLQAGFVYITHIKLNYSGIN